MHRIGVVIATRDRRDDLVATIRRLRALPERPPVVVVDNASRDGSADAARAAGATVVRLERDAGPSARTVGVRALGLPYAAFADDDSWWAPGALGRAVARLDRHDRVGLLAARVLVEPGGRLDPTCAAMRSSPLAEAELPGPAVLGFVACGAIVRSSAYLAVGGFHPRYGFGGEEELLALDLAAAGWARVYADDVTAHHAPHPGPRPGRDLSEQRNTTWTAWLRRPWPTALRHTLAVAGAGGGRRALRRALSGVPWVWRERQLLPAAVERQLRLVERARS